MSSPRAWFAPCFCFNIPLIVLTCLYTEMSAHGTGSVSLKSISILTLQTQPFIMLRTKDFKES